MDPGKKAVFISKRMIFDKKNDALKDFIMSRMAFGIDMAIKTTAGTPVKHGLMRADVRFFKTATGRWRVEAGKEYAAYQERGARADGTHRVKNYTTTGTSAGWFGRAIDGVIRNKRQYILEARKALGM